MSTTSVDSLAALLWLLALASALIVYLWTALALASMFRKMGEAPWRAWVPVLGPATVLAWGGFSPWLILLGFVPGPGTLAVIVLQTVAAHRINPGFGYGTVMTVVSAIAFPLWASVLGFGSARWLGRRPGTRPPHARPAAPVRDSEGSDPVPGPDRPVSLPDRLAGSFAPAATDAVDLAEVAPHSDAPRETSLPQRSGEQSVAEAKSRGVAEDPAQVPLGPAAPADEDAGVDVPAEELSRGAELARPPGVPFARIIPLPPPVEPISVVPGRSLASEPPSTLPVATPPREGRPPGSPPPDAPVREVPAAVVRPPHEVWAPPTEPGAVDAFPEQSMEISAVVGSPAAGAPIAAVEAMLDAADLDPTIVVRRRRPAWQLLPASGAPIDLIADVVIIGRLPEPHPAFPAAQLVSLDDATRTVSKTHARLERLGDGWQLVDLHSTNGVLVTGLDGVESEIEPGAVVPVHERFVLGDVELHLVRLGTAPRPPSGAGFDRPGSRA